MRHTVTAEVNEMTTRTVEIEVDADTPAQARELAFEAFQAAPERQRVLHVTREGYDLESWTVTDTDPDEDEHEASTPGEN